MSQSYSLKYYGFPMQHAPCAPVSAPANSKTRVLLASLIGTTIEFFDFYIYATAAVLIFPHLFFPESNGSAALLQSLATFFNSFCCSSYWCSSLWTLR